MAQQCLQCAANSKGLHRNPHLPFGIDVKIACIVWQAELALQADSMKLPDGLQEAWPLLQQAGEELCGVSL